ncbi:MAG: exo-alpha-sialidase [Caldilineaceae bacterium]|nr:exo-alpha-sialidase [Caldilineaceae bacterium]
MNDQDSGPGKGDILVAVGTRKGLFCFWSDDTRRTWRRSHHHMGWSTHATSYDPAHHTIYAATNSPVFGGLVQRSQDGSRTWEHFNEGLDFGEGEERRVREIWQVQPGHAGRPGEVWAGTGVAGLFRSEDHGSKWQPVSQLNGRHEQDSWQPGGGGLILHTILPDPSDANRVYVAVSAGGAYRSEDRGATWKAINHGVRADFSPDPYPETGQCVHKMVIHPARPNVLFQQNHCGVYRSDDRGDNWVDISEGLPSRFGFPMVVHPHDPHTVYVTPLVGDDQRFVPDGQMAVWRTQDDGASWQRLTAGLPDNAWLTILRDAMATDPCDDAGVYVGTTTGEVFFSRDSGEHWEVLADMLPPVLSISAMRMAA